MRNTGLVNSVSELYGSSTKQPRAFCVRGCAWVGFVIGAILLAPPAWADHSSVHATASGEVATTDNLFGSGRLFETFITVRPGLVFAYDAPQMIHDFNAEAEVTEVLTRMERPLINGRGGWKALFLVGPRLHLNFSINAGTGLLTQVASRLPSDQTFAEVMPSGEVSVSQADTGQTLSWIAGKHVRVYQGVLGRYGFTDDGAGTTAETREVGGNLGIERSFEMNSIILDASVSYLKLDRIAPLGAEIPSRFDQQVNPRGVVTWRHDIDKKWSTSAEGGVVYVNPIGIDRYNPDAPRRSGIFALFGGQVAYLESWGRAMLFARRNVAPSTFLAQNTVDESVNFQLAMPLPWLDETRRNPKLVALGSASVGRTQLINSQTGATDANFKMARVDLTVAYARTRSQLFGVRVETTYQTGDATAVMAIPSYLRNTVFFTFSLRYPDRVLGVLPRKRSTLRADGKDMLPTAGELIIPDIFDDGEAQ